LCVAACVPDERPGEKADSSRARSLASDRVATPINRNPAAASARLAPLSLPTRADSAAGDNAQLIRARFADDFERSELGNDFHMTGPGWSIQNGRLCGRALRNHPVWLRKRLPRNARIEFDAVSASADGDIKVEVWGDGRSAATSTSYTNASSYIAIFGGWKNTFHVLARIDEHAPDRAQVRVDPSGKDRRARSVTPNQTYHFKLERSDGKTLRWFVDDIEILTLDDPAPLFGPGHEHFGFNDWDTPVCFDNLVITPLAT
jgi:hypothetical protein